MTITPAIPSQSTDLSMPTMPGATGIANLESWVNALGHANKIASFMARSNFVPTPLRMKGKNNYKTPEELTMDVTAIIMAGASVGYDPFQAVQQMFIVHGSPAMYARSMVALVKSHGHKVDQVSASPDAVTVRARHRDDAEWHEFTWTYQRAERAGYTSNPKYKTNPQEMLYAKAATEACRRMFPEVLSGISPYSVEETELEDMGEKPEPAPVKTTKITRKPKVKAAESPVRPAPEPAPAAPAADPEPVADQETGEVQEPQPEPEPVDYAAEVEARYGNADALRELYNMASADGQDREILDLIAAAGREAKQ